MKKTEIIKTLESFSPFIKDESIRKIYTKKISLLENFLFEEEKNIKIFENDSPSFFQKSNEAGTRPNEQFPIFPDPKSLEDVMKMDILLKIFEKYTLTQIEEKIGLSQI